jgi:molybdopterin-containing oxidoreductase family membrane subunit
LKATLAGILKLGSNDTSAEGQERDKRMLKILGSIGIPIAIFGVHGGTGVLFAVVKAQAYWNSALFPVVFVISALVSGTALLTALYVIRSRISGKEIDISLVKSLAGWMVLFLLIDVGLQFFEILIGAYGLEEQELATLAAIFASDFSWSYWGVQMGIGVLVPLILYFNPGTRRSPTAMMLAGIAVVIGILGVRFNIVVPALTVPVLKGLPSGYYYPTWVEWASSGGIIGLGLLLYTLAIRYLPIDVE